MNEKLKKLTTAAVGVYADAMARVEAERPGTFAHVEQLLGSGQATGRLELSAPDFRVRFVLTESSTGREEVLFEMSPVAEVRPLRTH